MSQEIAVHSFSKAERLCSQKRIDTLFSGGESFIAYPLRIVYVLRENEEGQEYPISVLVSISKKKFKRAVKRNRVKRLVREAYRLNKTLLINEAMRNGKGVDIAFLYLKNELPNYQEIERAVLKTITVLTSKLSTKVENGSNP